MLKKMRKIMLVIALFCAISMPVVANAAVTLSPLPIMSTSYSNYYGYGKTLTVRNAMGNVLYRYNFLPVWRINTVNSINSCSSLSKYESGFWASPWKLIDSDSEWYGYEKRLGRYIERYYAEGIVTGWGFGLTGSVEIEGRLSQAFSATVGIEADVTLGEVQYVKYQGVATVGSSWSKCTYAYIAY